jgi:nitroreductase
MNHISADMEALEAIMTRRSIRRYTGEQVSPEHERKLLEAAMAAPSAHNRQPWHFIVVRSRETLDRIPEYHPYSRMLKEAGLAVVVCGDNRVQTTDFWTHDCSAATENMLIAANSLGLGAVWLGVYPGEELVKKTRELLGIPGHVTPLCIVSVGHPAEEKPPGNRYDESKVHREKW